MALETQALTRAFKYGSLDLADPGAAYTPPEVLTFYAGVYPELLSAAIEGPQIADGKMLFEFRRAVGTKGNSDDAKAHAAADRFETEMLAAFTQIGCVTDAGGKAISVFAWMLLAMNKPIDEFTVGELRSVIRSHQRIFETLNCK